MLRNSSNMASLSMGVSGSAQIAPFNQNTLISHLSPFGGRGRSSPIEESQAVHARQQLFVLFPDAIRVLAQSIEVNARALEQVQLALTPVTAPIVAEVDVETWHAVKGDLIELLREPALQARLAHFFSLIGVVSSLVEKLFAHSAGVNLAMGNSVDVREVIRRRLLELTPGLQEEATHLVALLNRAAAPRTVAPIP